MMNDCDRFEEIQMVALLGDASSAERHWAAAHGQECEPCCRSASRDRWLDAAFAVDQRTGEKGFSGAHRKLMKTFKEQRAYCCQVEGPFGPVYLAKTARGLCRVSFRRSEQDFLGELEKRELLPEFAPPRLAREAQELENYFSGRSKSIQVPIDFRLVDTPFQRQVLEACARIPFGQVSSYSDIARRIGNPEACRAVGGALGKNPVAIVIPCHRVVAANGTIGGYTGGVDIKRKLMDIEGISLEEGLS
jgi:methylated-DNA-[protein]-cysteine S-methyltransferase